jgi:sulfur-oxidizing protein SoxX
MCLLCHSGPFPEERFQGTLAPPLAGVGARLSQDEMRLRIVDSRRLNPDSIMPPYFRHERLNDVGAAWKGRTILSAPEVEDVVAFLMTLKE